MNNFENDDFPLHPFGFVLLMLRSIRPLSSIQFDQSKENLFIFIFVRFHHSNLISSVDRSIDTMKTRKRTSLFDSTFHFQIRKRMLMRYFGVFLMVFYSIEMKDLSLQSILCPGENLFYLLLSPLIFIFLTLFRRPKVLICSKSF